jgi:hypothetical protein
MQRAGPGEPLYIKGLFNGFHTMIPPGEVGKTLSSREHSQKSCRHFPVSPFGIITFSLMGIVDSTHERNSKTSRNFATMVAKPPHAGIGLLVGFLLD